jgi:hypothetical protein
MPRTGRVIAVFCLLAGLGQAQGGVDQFSVGPLSQGFNTSFSGNLQLGQEFRPTLTALDFVDLVLGDAGSDIGPGASFEVKIHAETIAGAVLGTSDVVSLPDNFNPGGSSETYTHFTFASQVALTPGATAVIEIVQLPPIVAGNANFLMYGSSLSGPDRYTDGRAIIGGAASQPLFDFNFREGVTVTSVPEPAGLTLLGLGALGMIGASWRRRQPAERPGDA